ncbi:CDP-alcohol phosphatidyltransferase family protein [Amycolatopsis suaedae]|uniref:CDP-alcohol phosphatidyltransferase family protein n=1 Tax=Amycolatopsis suaedae TaxID=2510978 RepID=A0A4V2ELD9_9PSEU|nr:CDP-alcohol phosphatidyltransferase family protein [Amycolatopsis suaedae]RZQ61225.1 CDP-alcohol phosphatidyltransferase family protein [Amycolatopsis suaedae]
MSTLQHTVRGAAPPGPDAAAWAPWLTVQVLLLAALATTTGLGPWGWLTGVAVGATACVLLHRAMRHAGRLALGPADHVTLARTTLAGGVTALVADPGGPPAALLATLAAVALALDFVDGRVARRTGTSSALGARFDMEVDAFLILVLSVHVAATLGPWVLAVGALRYLFVAAAWVWPWLSAPLPPSLARKAVAAAQGIVLVAAASGAVPLPAVAVGLALAALLWSFGRDVVWLYRQPTSERCCHV